MPRPSDPPVLLVKCYDLAKWLLERVEGFPKSQRFVFGQRLADPIGLHPRREMDSNSPRLSVQSTDVRFLPK